MLGSPRATTARGSLELRASTLELLRLSAFERIKVPIGSLSESRQAVAMPALIVDGWAAEGVLLDDGRQQIVRILMRGDVCGLGPLADQLQTFAITHLTLAKVSNDEAAAAALSREREVQAKRDLHQLIRLGRLSALERTASFFAETYERAGRAGLLLGDFMPLPFTQTQLSDHLGISSVHMNRVLQQLRRMDLIEPRYRTWRVKDLPALASLGHFPLEA